MPSAQRRSQVVLFVGVTAVLLACLAFLVFFLLHGQADAEPGSSSTHIRSLFKRNEPHIVGVIIENQEEARKHHQGLEKALLIEEFIVEGGITRFLAFFSLADLPERMGPVRSLRPYFVDSAKPWVKTFFFAGGSPEAFERVQQDPSLTSFNGLAYPGHFHRDLDIAAPHNLFTTGKDILALLEKPIPSTHWPPYTVGRTPKASDARHIHLNFFSKTHNVDYIYDRASRTYSRKNGILISKAMPLNILILEMPITGIGEAGRLTIPVQGKGKALLFRTGTVQEGYWFKNSDNEGFIFEDVTGMPLVFSKGQTWMTVLPNLERVTWEKEI